MTHSDPSIEKALLGIFLQDADGYYSAAILARDDFSLDSHRRIYGVLSDMYGDNRHVDLATVADELRKRGQVDAVGGVAYLASLTEGIPRRSNPETYVKMLR